MRCSTLLMILTAVLLYLVMGALVFGWLETPEEKLAYEQLLTSRHDFLHNHSCVREKSLTEFTQKVVDAIEAGVDARSTANFTSRWDLSNAFFFCGTIITTIGEFYRFTPLMIDYMSLLNCKGHNIVCPLLCASFCPGFGNLSPKTQGGQLFCIFYALVGIPMFGILLAGVGDHLGTILRRAVAKIEGLFLKRVSATSVRVISAVFSILIGCLIFIALPTLVFQEVEKWTLLEAGYFVVITLTTVGFGDYVADNRRNGSPLYKPLVWLWIVFGLAYFASILTMIGNWLRVLSKKTRAEMEELRAHATDWTQNIQNMSMDFRIPVPLDLNDPFQLQRRCRRKRHRGAHHRHPRSAVDGLPHGVSLEAEAVKENGHLFVSWPGSRYNTASDTRLYAKYEMRPGSRLTSGQRSRPVSRPELRSQSKPASKSGSRSVSGSDSRSEISSESWSGSDWNSQESGSVSGPETAEKRPLSIKDIPAVLVASYSALPAPSPSLSSPSSPSSPQRPSLLDFFGENLAYIDESSDTLSDRIKPSGSGTNRPRKPKRRSMRRQLPYRSPTGLQSECSSELQPPSNPPTPPPLKD
ncbi:potassium channel subfamily K member 4 [Astyanax mexicanus]|uniref:Potassium channel subfamily K member 4 n=1 Tax=Astyanax mexicanus TaxID=7994 RepID=A0A8T2LNS2_ASTMX|nr:potassium channel subfamily K member 4 [Astyanax mexicanus]